MTQSQSLQALWWDNASLQEGSQGLPVAPFPWPASAEPHLTGSSPTLVARSASVSCGVTAPSPWVLVPTRFCLCPPRMESLFLPTLWKFCNQTPSRALKVRFPGDSQPFRLIPWLGSLMWGSERSQPSLVLFFSSVWDAHPTGMGFDFIVIAPLLLSCCSFSFVFGH